MKMLGFMIALTLAYWLMSSYAQTVIAGTEPCSAGRAAASAEHDRTIAEMNRRTPRGEQVQPSITFEISPADSTLAGEKLASLSSSASKQICGG
ncbi:hypothetical protein [Hyphococcus sp.]|uniref:hypothetical protein n=1 Tax=Hyphococcus sp. TaxID=2038636 RepID=UPI00208653D6|nr:MAG: hypothetical protein DHS20C04_10610 [Marinicaulis sp.]